MLRVTRFFCKQDAKEDSLWSANSSPWHSVCGDFKLTVQYNSISCQLHFSLNIYVSIVAASDVLCHSWLFLCYFVQREWIFLLSWFYLSCTLSPSHSSVLPHFLLFPCFYLLPFPFLSFPIFIFPPSAAVQLQEKSPNNLPALWRMVVFFHVDLITVSRWGCKGLLGGERRGSSEYGIESGDCAWGIAVLQWDAACHLASWHCLPCVCLQHLTVLYLLGVGFLQTCPSSTELFSCGLEKCLTVCSELSTLFSSWLNCIRIRYALQE